MIEPVPDPDRIDLEFKCLRARQPVGDVFLASMPFKTITKISYFDVRRVIQEDRDVERYLGVQRPLDPRRVADLEKYVNYYDASFPTAIIIAIEERFASYDEETFTLKLSNVPEGEDKPVIPISNLARVIDGQHRIAGLMKFSGENFDVPVSIYIGADLEDQAHVFSTVNLEQTKVSRSLVYDLYELSKARSPQKTCHNIAVALDKDKSSPFFGRIKRLGTTTGLGRFEPLSQAGFVEVVMRYITLDPKGDRDIILKGKKLPRANGDDVWRFPFRNAFIDENDVKIAEAIYSYFGVVAKIWPDAWANADKKGLILNRTNGFRALFRCFAHLYREQGVPGISIAPGLVEHHFKSLGLKDSDFNIDNFEPGTGGEARLYRVLIGKETLSGQRT